MQVNALRLSVALIAAGIAGTAEPVPAGGPSPADSVFARTERAFSARSGAVGPCKAFLEFLAADVYRMHATEPIQQGSRAVEEQFASFPATASLLWEPTEAGGAADGDLGYTRGKSQVKTKKPDGTETVRNGTYATVWKRVADGSLKGIADMGSPQPIPTLQSGEMLTRTALRHEVSAAGDCVADIGTFTVTRADGAPAKTPPGKYLTVWRTGAAGKKSVVLDVQTANPSPAAAPAK